MATLPSSQEERIYPAYKLAALRDALIEDGISVDSLLQDTGLTAEELLDPATRVSYRQLIAGFRVGAHIEQSPLLALRSGRSIHLTACGIFGYALLSSSTPQDAFDFAVKHQRILGPAVGGSYRREGDMIAWSLEPLFANAPTDALYRFSLEYHLAIIGNFLRDAIDPACSPAEIRVAYPRPAHAAHYAEYLHCPASFDQGHNEIRLSAHWLENRQMFANPITATLVREICDPQMATIVSASGVSAKVYQALIERPRVFPDIDAVAASMNQSARTLRRKLDAEGTSYRSILAEVRKHLALRYLRDTPMTNEEIAERLGYSDAANFRKAFKQWTHGQPSGFRRAP